MLFFSLFFFQAEDGIRDRTVTGVQTCALPISRMMLRVLLPAAAPGLVAAAMFAFMTAWNDYLFAVILTSSMAAKTVPVIVAGFATDVTTERTLMAAGGRLAVVPPLVLAVPLHRRS